MGTFSLNMGRVENKDLMNTGVFFACIVHFHK